MTTEEAVAFLDGLDEDKERDHIDADQILLDFLRENGFGAIVEAYERVKKRYQGFFYA